MSVIHRLSIRRAGLPAFELRVYDTDTVHIVKLRLQEQLNIPAEELRLVYAGRAIDGELTLKDLKLFESAKFTPFVQLIESSAYARNKDGAMDARGLHDLPTSLCPDGTVPSGGATVVDPRGKITLRLNKLYAPKQCHTLVRWANDQSYPQADLITVEDTTNNSIVEGTLAFLSGALTFVPKKQLRFDTTYQVTLHSRDLPVKECCTTKHLETEFNFSFKTADSCPRTLHLELVRVGNQTRSEQSAAIILVHAQEHVDGLKARCAQAFKLDPADIVTMKRSQDHTKIDTFHSVNGLADGDQLQVIYYKDDAQPQPQQPQQAQQPQQPQQPQNLATGAPAAGAGASASAPAPAAGAPFSAANISNIPSATQQQDAPAALPQNVMDWLAERRLAEWAGALADLGVQDMKDLHDDVQDYDLRKMGMRELQIRRFRGA